MGKLVSSFVGEVQVEPFVGSISPKLDGIDALLVCQDLDLQFSFPVFKSRTY
jgi:hypothetical protein